MEIFGVGIGRISVPELETSSEIGCFLCSGTGCIFGAQGVVEFQFLSLLGAGYISLPLVLGPGCSFTSLFNPTSPLFVYN